MPVVALDAKLVRDAVCPADKLKLDLYSDTVTGFVAEIRKTGGKTYYLRYRDTHGKLRQHKIGDAQSISFDKARHAAEKLRSTVVLGGNPAEEKKIKRSIPKIEEVFCDTYLPHLQTTRRNFESDFSFWKIHLLPKFGNRHLDELKQQDVIDAQQAMRKAGYAAGTANKWIVQLRYMYNVAKKQGIPGAENNPAADIKQFRVEGRERFLSAEETERLRIAVERSENTQLKYIVALLLMLGCRKNELLQATWDQFDLPGRTWKIPLTKSGKSRHVSLSMAAIAVLEKVPRWEGCPYVVPNIHTRKPFTGIYESFATAVRRAKIGHCRIHDLRHSFASNLVNAGQSLFVVSRALGHSTTQMSERYAHIANDTLLAAADAAANAVSTLWSESGKSPATREKRQNLQTPRLN